ncbi:MAG: hypothetical protein Q8O27_00210 [Enterobacteriaceae bacterium]|nr:hypothetical protein [Enterobacteriaceae bacterium]
MHNHDIVLKSLGYSIKIKSNICIGVLFKKSIVINNFIPGLKIIETKNDCDLAITHKQDKVNRSYESNGNNIFIIDDWRKEIPIYIVHLLYKFFSRAYLKNGVISLHSSVAEKNDNLYLLVGFSGVGKTSILIKLLEDYNFKMVSGNKILLKVNDNKMSVVGVTSVLSIRNESPTVLNKVIPKKSENFCNRRVFQLPKKYFSQQRDYRKIYIIYSKINNGVAEFYEIDKNDILPILYPMSLDLVNREVIMFDGNLLIPDNISLQIKRRIFKLLKNIKKNSLVYHASGGLDYICDNINKL